MAWRLRAQIYFVLESALGEILVFFFLPVSNLDNFKNSSLIPEVFLFLISG